MDLMINLKNHLKQTLPMQDGIRATNLHGVKGAYR